MRWKRGRSCRRRRRADPADRQPPNAHRSAPPTLFGHGELLQPARRRKELVAVDVRVARHGREIGVAEVLGDEAGVAQLLPEPGRGGVAKRVRGDVLLYPGTLRGSPDDVGEDRLLQASTGE